MFNDEIVVVMHVNKIKEQNVFFKIIPITEVIANENSFFNFIRLIIKYLENDNVHSCRLIS
jgi:hypothetical protein